MKSSRGVVAVLLTLAYSAAVLLAYLRHSRAWAAAAVACLTLLLALSVRGAWRFALLAAGTAIAVVVARGALPAVPLLLPPILIPASLAWLFGRTLAAGRTPLIVKLAHILHAPSVPGAELLAYMRRVTGVWTAALAAIALFNAWLAWNLAPGGIAELAGIAPLRPVSGAQFAWLSNVVTYVLIAALFAGEFVIRIARFPDYPLRNPLELLRRARARLPALRETLRRE